MIVGPKYKICKRLGSAVFEKCQTQKFTLTEARQNRSRGKRRGMPSDYKRQLIEKQKMRYTYGLSERQLSRYVKESIEKGTDPQNALMLRLESRLDNVVYRLGLAKTRRQARQLVSHGHIMVGKRKVTIPSYQVVTGEVVAVREESKPSILFTPSEEETENVSPPQWLTFDRKILKGNVTSVPTYDTSELLFDLEQVFEYYSR